MAEKLSLNKRGVDTEFGESGISNIWQKISEYTAGNAPRFEVAGGVTFSYNNWIYYGYVYTNINATTYSNELETFDLLVKKMALFTYVQ